MSLAGMLPGLAEQLAALDNAGSGKRRERIITGIRPASGAFGPRCLLAGHGGREFLRMNANSYLGLSLHPRVLAAAEEAGRRFGTGPGAVRFISGTYDVHAMLEEKLARFHGRQAALVMNSAYAAMLGVLPLLLDEETLVLSDSLNHNCIINAIRLGRTTARRIYRHLDLDDLAAGLAEHRGRAKRAVVVSDGVFSMRGDHVPLAGLARVCARFEGDFPEGVITVIDDSHGVGAFGATGRGTEEYSLGRADLLIATLGKAMGVNGGYIAADALFIAWLREKAPLYIYSNPIGPAEAAAAAAAVDILDSGEGLALLEHLRGLTSLFRNGLAQLGLATFPGDHPIVPLRTGDSAETRRLVAHLFERGILATGLGFPVVPKGEEEVRFQINASHTEGDIRLLLEELAAFSRGQSGP